MVKKKSSRLTKAILETAKDMFEGGVLGENEYEKITLRHLNKAKLPKLDPMTSEEIRNLREEAHLSQAAFARYLNLTVGYISQLERGLKRPTGAVLALLNVIRRKGFDVILP
jgi:putative transcriptional regulator